MTPARRRRELDPLPSPTPTMNLADLGHGPANTAAISELEAAAGALPRDYHAFLEKHNGVRPIPDEFTFVARDGRAESSAVRFFLPVSSESGGETIESYRVDLRGRIPPDAIPVAADDFGNLVLLRVRGESAGRVDFWDHEKEALGEEDGDLERPASPIAESFAEFLKRLAVGDATAGA